MRLAENGELLKGKTIEDQKGYVINFMERGIALLHDSRLLPELPKRNLAGKQMELGIRINIMVSREGTDSSKRHMVELIRN